MILTDQYQRAVVQALRLHATQMRKGTSIPYPAHLLATSALVMQFGGNEDQAIAGLLHDAGEDAGGRATIQMLRFEFGDPVAEIVEGCTDAFEVPKPPWRPRKEAYIASLRGKGPETLLVSACDKLDNARAILVDLHREGAHTLDRFSGGKDTAWYYRAITDEFARLGQGTQVKYVARELNLVVREIENLAAQ